MKSIIVIPSYWRKGDLGNDDTVYDHPTDLNDVEETISRTLESLKYVKGNFDVLVIGAPTRSAIGSEMDKKLISMLKQIKLIQQVHYFGNNSFLSLKKFIKNNFPNYSSLISNRGYANIRNLCILLPHILDFDIAILIDDDELITDENYIYKATEFIGNRIENKTLGLVVGFYKNPNGSIYIEDKNNPWWELVWNKTKLMNDTFKKIFEREGRLVDTTIAFGGNMIIYRDVWIKIPFDPLIKRGEDMDFLRNVKMSKFGVKLDKELFIEHYPPKSKTPYLTRLKEDIYRFLYAQAKNEHLGIDSNNYLPYPGSFFENTQGKVILTELLYYIFQNKDELIKNNSLSDLLDKMEDINLIHDNAVKFAQENKDSFNNYQKSWEEMMKSIQGFIPKDIFVRI